MLFPDQDLTVPVIRLSGDLREASVDGTTLLAGAGAPMAGILELSLEAGLSGLEMTAGLPGTAGGAAMGNAGSAGRGLAELIEGLELLDPGGRRLVLARKDLSPLHRTLNLPPELEGSIVIGLRLSLARSDPALARGEARRLLAARRAGQPTGLSLGCVFRNPPSESAGRLIDLCGLKGEIEGGAEVSRRHANFIMNTGRARSAEVLTLAARVRGAVEARFGLRLVPEIKILGQDGREAGLPMTGAEEAPAA
jgi:UDP-N-acetylmuramate dehydrogenase